jgi:hypothetical protein
MQIDVTAPNNNIYTGINTKFTDGKIYGITTLNIGRIIMQFGGSSTTTTTTTT